MGWGYTYTSQEKNSMYEEWATRVTLALRDITNKRVWVKDAQQWMICLQVERYHTLGNLGADGHIRPPSDIETLKPPVAKALRGRCGRMYGF